jgi:hypothetical protein
LVLPYEDFEDLAAEKRSRLQKLEWFEN